MFAHRFFGSRYFAPRYFGDGGDGAPVVVVATLICAEVRVRPALTAAPEIEPAMTADPDVRTC